MDGLLDTVAKNNPEIRKCEELYLDAIGAAQKQIYIENQYITSHSITGVIAEPLKKPEGPDVILILPESSNGWLEVSLMDQIRAHRLDQLKETDKYDRLRILYPVDDKRGKIHVHAKVCIIDNKLLRIGSANLTNRSMGTDSECDLAIEAVDEGPAAEKIAEIRNRLVAEHLGLKQNDLSV